MNCGRAEEEDIYGNSQVVVSFFKVIFTPYLGKIPILTIIFFKWVETSCQAREDLATEF